MTSEINPPSLEIIEPRLVAVHAFKIAALGFNAWVSSEGAQQEVYDEVYDIREGKERSTEERRNTAAMQIMQAIAYLPTKAPSSIAHMAKADGIAGAEDLYTRASQVSKAVGIDQNHVKQHLELLKAPVACFHRDITPQSQVEKTVQQARRSRGVILEERTNLSDIIEATESISEKQAPQDLQITPGGTFVEVYEIPRTPTQVIEVPFYQQYVSVNQGAEEYLGAFLDDIMWVSSQF